VAQLKKDGNQTKIPQEGSGVGALLRASRLRIGEDLRDVARNLRIRHVYMQAIEDSNYGDLPGTAYAVGFVRAYAEYLGLDSGEVVRRFKEEYQGVENRPDLVFPVPVTERSVPGSGILILSMVAALIGYGAWYFLSNSDDVIAEKVPSLPERLAALLPKGDDDQSADAVKEETPRAAEEQKAEAEPATEEEKPEPVAESEEKAPENETPSQEPTEEAEKTEAAEAEQSQPVASEPEAVRPPEPQEQVQEAAPAPSGATEHSASEFQAAATATEAVAEKKPEPVVEQITEAPKVVEKVQKKVAPEDEPYRPASETDSEAEVEKKPVAKPVEPAQPEPVQAAQEAEKKPVVVAEAPQEAEKTEEAAAPAETPKPETVEKVQEPGNSRVMVRAKTASWIQVRDDEENKMLLTRLLRPGDSYRVPDKKGLMLLTSNAGALEILVDGKAVPSIGDFGAVRRSVSLDPDKLLGGSAVGE
jgi:cytoskeleton protein RodZ